MKPMMTKKSIIFFFEKKLPIASTNCISIISSSNFITANVKTPFLLLTHITSSSPSSCLHRVKAQALSSSSFLKALGSLSGFTGRSKRPGLFYQRTFFCSGSSSGGDGGSGGSLVEVEVKSGETDTDSAEVTSSAIVPTNPWPEDYLTVLALPLPHRPLFPCFYMPIYVKDPKLLAALQESRKRQAPYAGAFLLEDEPGTDPSKAQHDRGKNVYPHPCSFSSSDHSTPIMRLKLHSFLGFFPKGKQPLRRFSSLDDTTKIVNITELISRQHWSNLKIHVQHADHNALLHKLLFSGADPELILRYLTWSERELNFSHSLELTFKLLHSLTLVKKYPKVRSFFDKFVKNDKIHAVYLAFHCISMSGESFCVNSIIADILLLAYVRNMKLHLAFDAFKRAGDYGFKLSALSCNPLLSALVKEGDIKDLEFAYKEMIRRRIKLNLISFNTVINGLCKVGRLNKAGDIMEDMQVQGVSPNVVTYNTLIDGYCKKGRVGKMYKADALLKEMVAKGIGVNEVTYNILIDGFCKDVNVSTGMKVFNEMQKQGLKPNVITYNILIKGLCNVGKVDEAIDLRDQMIGSGLKPNAVTNNVLINGLCKNKMMKEALELFKHIEKQGVAPNVTTYNTLIDAYCKDGRMEDAFGLRSLMVDRGILPDVSTYNCLLSGLCRKGDTKAAMNLRHEMVSNGLRADIITYNILIDSLCTKGGSRKALRLLDEMLEKGLDPSHVTYHTLMDCYCREGNLRAALDLRIHMEKKRKRANVVTFNVLIKGFCRKGNLEAANGLLNEMLEKGLVPNRTTYEIIKEEMMEKGFVPDIEGHLYNVPGNS